MSLTVLRVLGDGFHVASSAILLYTLIKHQKCTGLSLITHELYCLVFVSRYLDFDIHFDFLHLYNLILKIFFLGSSFYTVYLIRTKLRSSYDEEHDRFKAIYLIVPCFLVALFVNEGFGVVEILWAFSIYLESVAIMPQLFLSQRTGEMGSFTSNFVFCLGAYRGLYLLNWVYRLFVYNKLPSFVILLGGVVQVALYGDFFFYYFKNRRGGALKLPK